MQFLKSLKTHLLRSGKIGWVVYKCLQLSKTGVQIIFDGRLRSELFYKKVANRNHHQIVTYTITDRYPLLFAECTKYFKEFKQNPAPTILSFGCSTGEEVFTLGSYLPLATIIGFDINRWCINQCRKKNHNPKHFFYNRNSTDFENIKDCDAIFCMAVLQKTENRTNTDNRKSTSFTFSKFENEILILNQKLKVGGLFIIDEADFNFADTLCANEYKPLPFKNNQLLKERPLFNKYNSKISETQLVNRIFVKIK